ncbi:tRNA (adenosine(37)-N6)-dimethylallyltransferase MiaA [Mycoplasma sp. P36-A1]|uniref:tRNA (adenosine(37)-N6)-dimethylallyltransferase MiaA n=1 Tax=Mycoplasma sp. P36-A1 TaxID=3252900 RepID=UPI003C2FB3C6
MLNKVICIVGATGIGKTKLSIELAKYLNTEIINGDSIQVFKEGNILSAKASLEEQEGIKHHLLDCFELEKRFDIAEFKKQADILINDINKKGKIPIVVGGSGLYIKALLYDYKLDNIKEKSQDVELKYQELDNNELFEYLKEIDLEASLPLHPNNRKRVLRAIDIYENNDVKKSEFINKQNHEMVYDALVIGLTMERTELYNIINLRVDKMLNLGLLKEVEDLTKRYDINSDFQLFQAIGFKEFIPYINQELDIETAIEKVKQNSRRYAKKQTTWFNNQMKVKWINVDVEDFNNTIKEAKKLVGEHFDE